MGRQQEPHLDRIARLEGEVADLRLYRDLFSMSSDGMYVSDAEDRILVVNGAFTHITGHMPADVLGRDPSCLLSGLQGDDFVHSMTQELDRHGHWEGEVWFRRKKGEVFRVWQKMSVERDADGRITRRIAVFRDTSEALDTAERLWQRSNFDLLTGLPNRSLMLDRLLQALVMADRQSRRVALVFIGLDGFTNINDTLGHTIGDKVLIEAARRFQAAIRCGDSLTRFGGDEFTAVLTGISTVDEVESVVRTIQESLNEPFSIEAHQILISCSIGISLWPGDGDDVEALMRNSTSALRQAKDAGRNTFRFFTPSMDARAQMRAKLAGELSDALENGEFALVYQPVIDVETGLVSGAEALLRWTSRYVGMVSPDQFVPLAEEMGLIVPIGEWLLHAACHEAASWQTLRNTPLGVAINVSPRQVQQSDIAAVLDRALRESGLPAERVTIEITEGLLLSGSDEVLNKLRHIRDLGARIAVDDFGIGYASLSYLKHFPVDVLKIDRSFVSGALENQDDARLIEAIISMGHSMNMKVVGEGVETEGQMEFLRSQNCDYVQGYRFSPPLSIERFHAFIAPGGVPFLPE